MPAAETRWRKACRFDNGFLGKEMAYEGKNRDRTNVALHIAAMRRVAKDKSPADTKDPAASSVTQTILPAISFRRTGLAGACLRLSALQAPRPLTSGHKVGWPPEATESDEEPASPKGEEE